MPSILLRHRAENALHHLWFRLKAALGQNVQVDKNFFAGHAVIGRALGRLPEGFAITCEGRSDGVGMQALARISTIIFARLFGATYVHAPFDVVDHASPEEAERWEKQFGFGEGAERLDPARHRLMEYGAHLLTPADLGAGVVMRFQQFWWLTRRYPALLTQCAPHFRARFDYAPEPAGDVVRICVHVRRGDVSRERNALRFTPDRVVLARIAQAQAAARELGLQSHVELHSQGDEADFAAFAAQGCELQINRDAVWTMRRLAEAHVLLTARSSFSFVAGLMNPGLVIYERAFNPPPPEWLACDAAGGVDMSALRAALACSVERSGVKNSWTRSAPTSSI